MSRTDYVEMPFNPAVLPEPGTLDLVRDRTLEALAEECVALERRPLLDTLRLWIETTSTGRSPPTLSTSGQRDVLYLVASVTTRTEIEVALDGLGAALRDTREYRLLIRFMDWMARLSW